MNTARTVTARLTTTALVVVTVPLAVAGTAAASTGTGATTSSRLMINGDAPVSRQQGDVHAYVECAGGERPGPLRTTALGMPGDWYQLRPDARGFWGRLTVINAASPGTHVADVACGTETVRAPFSVVDTA